MKRSLFAMTTMLILVALLLPCSAQAAPGNSMDFGLLRVGDILLGHWQDGRFPYFDTLYFTHSALYIGNGEVVEALDCDRGVVRQSVEAQWREADIVAVIHPPFDYATRRRAADYALAQVGKPFAWPIPGGCNFLGAGLYDQSAFYCSKLVWWAYHSLGIEIAPPSSPLGYPVVSPDDIELARAAWQVISPHYLNPPEPTSVSPSNDPNANPLITTRRPTFQWTAPTSPVGSVVLYELQVSRNPAFEPGGYVGLTSDTSFTFETPLAEGQWYYRIRAKWSPNDDSGNNANWSNRWSQKYLAFRISTATPGCLDSATFVADVTYPDGSSVNPGQSFNKTWRLRNSGTCTWSGYSLAFVSGDRMNGPASVSVPTTTPGQTVDITVPLVAPSSAGTYLGNWQLKNSYGVNVSGGGVWVSIEVKPSTPIDHITLFDVSPPSPSSATSVHLVARARYFPEFRSMRFVVGADKWEMTNFRTIGDQVEISTDWNTASLDRGTYALAVEVAKNSGPEWASAERQVIDYTLIGTPAPVGRPPDRPILKEPYDWYVRDASGAPASVHLCVYPASDPDGDGSVVQYFFQVLNQIGDPVQNSGWITSTCYDPVLTPGIYGWKVKSGNDNGALASDWSQYTWHFSVASGEVAIGDISFRTYDSDQEHMCVNVTFGGIIAPDVYAWLNRAPDGSESGEWRLLDHFGPHAEDCSDSNQQHGFRIYPREYITGRHAIKITAIKRDPDHNPVSSDSEGTAYDIAYRRPSNFQPIAPSTYDNNGTFWNTLTQSFQWTRALRDDSGYELRASTSSDIWSDPAPVVDALLPSATISYTYAFGHDYDKLYWSVKAMNSIGSVDTGNALWFGIDRVAPTSTVQALLSTTYESVFQVTWSGSDNRAGIRSYDIQYQDSGRSDWNTWLSDVQVTKTYDLFTGQPGHTYSFRSRATDNANNTSSYPVTADTSIKIDPAARPLEPWWNTAYAGKRTITILDNMTAVTLPTGYPVHLHFDGTTAAEMYAASQSGTKCDDLRIVANNTTEIDRLVESCTPSLIDIRFRTQVSIAGGTSDSTTHQLYYSNLAATNPPAGRNRVLYPVLDSNHLRVFDMREGAGSTLHDLAGGVDATIASELSWDPSGKFGPALLFPGDRTPEPRPAVYAGIGPQPACDFTVELWLKRLTGHQYGGMLAQQEIGGPNPWRWVFRVNDERLALGVEGTSGSVQSIGTLSAPTFFSDWHHVAVAHSCSGEVRFYIDGRLDSVRTMSTGNVNPAIAPLRLGNNAYNNDRLAGYMSGFALSNIVRTDLSYGQFADITSEPSAVAGQVVSQPVTGTPDLAVLDMTTYPNPDGGLLVQIVVQNQGSLNTQNGFYTDLYGNHQPTGPGDFTGSIKYWVASPITAGVEITLATVITSGTISGTSMATVLNGGIAEVTSTLYAQADSTGVVSETTKLNNIYTGTQVCIATADSFEEDNTPESAKQVSPDGSRRTHNVHALGDQDWIKFQATAGVTYTIQTSNLGLAADTYVYLYGTDGSTLIAQNDDYGGTLASRLDWCAPASGTYYVMVKHWNPNVGGCGTAYDLSVASVRFGTVVGAVNLQGRASKAGAVISVGAYTTTSDVGGAFTFTDVPAGVYTATISLPGYLSASRVVSVTEAASIALPGVTLLGGDADRDDDIDIYDLTILGGNFGLRVPPSDARADINGDGGVNIFDLVLVGTNYGLAAPRPWP